MISTLVWFARDKKTETESGYYDFNNAQIAENIFNHDLIFIPLKYLSSIMLCIVDVKKKELCLYNPNGRNLEIKRLVLKKIWNFLDQVHRKMFKQPLKKRHFTFSSGKNIPLARNFYDTGVFTCLYAESISRNVYQPELPNKVLFYRHKLIHEVLTRKIHYYTQI